jgi:tetratricopeptide (TPR) repeat protein
MMGCRFRGITCVPLAEFEAARRYLEQGLALYDPNQRSAYAALTVDDPEVVMLYYLSWVLLYLGEFAASQERATEALTRARRLAQPYTLAHALCGISFVELSVKAYAKALSSLEELIALCTEHGIAYFRAVGAMFRGYCLAAMGMHREGLDLLRGGFAACHASGSLLYQATFLTMIAEVHQRSMELDLAASSLDHATKVMELTNARNDEANICRQRAELQWARGDASGAIVSFQQALAVARHQKSRLWELRAAIGLGQIWREQGKGVAARELLKSICEDFDGAQEVPLLLEARDLLQTLA